MTFLVIGFVWFTSVFWRCYKKFSLTGICRINLNIIVEYVREILCLPFYLSSAWMWYSVCWNWETISIFFKALNWQGDALRYHIYSLLLMLSFFSKQQRLAVRRWPEIIDRFFAISGQQLNLQKSHFKFSPNTPLEVRQRFRGVLQMNLVPSLEMHLGVPIDLVGSKHSSFQFIVDKVAAKVNSWNYVALSQFQKTILINIVLITNVLSCMEVPVSIASKVDSILAKFL